MTFTFVLPLRRRRTACSSAAPMPAFDLPCGQRRGIALAPGAGFLVAAGQVVLLRPARWFGDERMAPADLLLCEGDAGTSVESEHVTVVAKASSRLILRQRSVASSHPGRGPR